MATDLRALTPHLAGQVATFEHEHVGYGDAYTLAAWQRRYVERWEQAAGPVTSGLTVVDCGTGSGYMAIELARRGARVVACDLTFASLERLVRIAGEVGVADRMLAVCCTADRLPVRTDAIEAFIANGLIEHLPDDRAAAVEWARVCRAAATLMVAVPSSLSLVHLVLRPVQRWRDRQVGHLRRYDVPELQRALAGWLLLSAVYTGHWSKAWRVLANMTRVVRFDEEAMEHLDAAHEGHAHGSSNIVSFWRRGDLE
ncbi:MAG: class I SAM-dependent methyltransferase [Chloroflexota bacterium]